MTAPAGLEALRQPGLAEFDRAGLLPAAAVAGAQIRSVRDSSDLPQIDRPRAMVVLGSAAAVDTAFLTALVGRGAGAPIVAATALPAWVGALDLVVVLAARVDDDAAAEAGATARRRGATTIVRAADSGPVADAAGPFLFAPVVAVPEALAAPARWALLALVAARAGLGPTVELSRTADLLDATALACHPAVETFLNPGINLAEYLGEGTGLLIGCDLLADAVAGHAARALADLGGVAAGVLTAADAAGSPAVLRRAGAGKDLFSDPFTGGEPGQLIRPLLVSTTTQGPTQGRPGAAFADRNAADSQVLSAMLRMFPGSMHLDGSSDALPAVGSLPNFSAPEPSAREPSAREPSARESLAQAATTGSGQGIEGTGSAVTVGADSFDAAVAAVLRLDFAAVYLGIATGQLVPLDFPDGLGRAGGTRWAVRPATVGGVWNESRA